MTDSQPTLKTVSRNTDIAFSHQNNPMTGNMSFIFLQSTGLVKLAERVPENGRIFSHVETDYYPKLVKINPLQRNLPKKSIVFETKSRSKALEKSYKL